MDADACGARLPRLQVSAGALYVHEAGNPVGVNPPVSIVTTLPIAAPAPVLVAVKVRDTVCPGCAWAAPDCVSTSCEVSPGKTKDVGAADLTRASAVAELARVDVTATDRSAVDCGAETVAVHDSVQVPPGANDADPGAISVDVPSAPGAGAQAGSDAAEKDTASKLKPCPDSAAARGAVTDGCRNAPAAGEVLLTVVESVTG